MMTSPLDISMFNNKSQAVTCAPNSPNYEANSTALKSGIEAPPIRGDTLRKSMQLPRAGVRGVKM